MMLYRNTRTGAEIETKAVIAGGDWKAAGEKPAAPKAPAQEKQTDRKLSGRQKK